MQNDVFKFKQFTVRHIESTMKVGVDAVLLGAWCDCPKGKILEVGCGCGVISLMLSQRFYNVEVTAIDIHEPSVNETKFNFSNSNFKNKQRAEKISFQDLIERTEKGSFSAIVSNPPFFDSGLKELNNPRLRARHQGELTIPFIIENSASLLKNRGKLSLIMPTEYFFSNVFETHFKDISIERYCIVYPKLGKKSKRTLVEFIKTEEPTDREQEKEKKPVEESLILFEKDNLPTKEYKDLCHEFYLYF